MPVGSMKLAQAFAERIPQTMLKTLAVAQVEHEQGLLIC